MDDLLSLLERTRELSPAERRAALMPYANRAGIGRLFSYLKAGRETRAILRVLTDFALSAEHAETIAHYFFLHDGLAAGLLHDPDAKVRKTTAQLLGRADADAFAPHLIKALAWEETAFVRPSMILALGNARGSSAALEFLSSYRIPACEEKHYREQEVALLKALSSLNFIEHANAAPGNLRRNTELLAYCPNPKITAAELQELGFSAKPTKSLSGYVLFTGADSFASILRGRTFYDVGIYAGKYDDLAAAITAASSPDTIDTIRQLYALEDVPYRIEIRADGAELHHAGRKKAAEEIVARIGRQLTNSPSAYALELRLIVSEAAVHMLLCPANIDHRFDYRVDSISASIHPAVAASVCYASSSVFKPNAKVLDCFCGAGTLLFERAQYPYASLMGSDISAQALGAARKNERLRKSGAHFYAKNANTPFNEQFDEVICNMPFGIRVGNHSRNRFLYREFMKNLLSILKDSGTAFLFTHEKRLLTSLLGDDFDVVAKYNFSAGGLYPCLFILKKMYIS